MRRAADLARAARTEVRHFPSFAETFGGIGEPQDRADLVAQEQHRDGDQHQRGADHPGEEDVGIRDIGGAARREYAHDRVVELDADLEQRRAPDGVDPERPADLLADLLRQRLIHQREERLRSRRRQIVHRQEIDDQAELVLRNAPQLHVVGTLRIDPVDLDQGGDVRHHAGREPLRDQVVVPLHEHEGDDRLQHHHGHDDDQERAPIEALRHDVSGRHAGAVVELAQAVGGGAQGSEARAQRGDADVERGHGTVTSR